MAQHHSSRASGWRLGLRIALLGVLALSGASSMAADDLDKGVESVGPANYRPAEARLRSDTVKLVLKPEEQVEVKTVLAEGQVITYQWTSKGAKEGELYVDFHGHTLPAPGAQERVVRYAEGEHTAGQGAIVAPLSGEHGWFWLNMGTKPVTIELRVHGFHTKVEQHRVQTPGKS